MTFKHGDKIFVAIAVLICVEISTFSRMYLKASRSTSSVSNQDSSINNRRTSSDPTTTTIRSSDDASSSSGDAFFNVSSIIDPPENDGNAYIRARNQDSINEEDTEIIIPSSSDATTTAPSASPFQYRKTRIVFLGESSDTASLPSPGRSVEALGDLDCCSRDPFDYISPEEKPFYEECDPMVD